MIGAWLPESRWAFTRGESPEEEHESSPTIGEGEEPGRLLACSICGHAITSTADRITVGEQHEHEGVNPHGHRFRFGCFGRAPGCVSRGVPSKQFTWFPGYFWHVQDCARCNEHIGWLFFHPDDSFYGLILDRLVEIEEPPSGQ